MLLFQRTWIGFPVPIEVYNLSLPLGTDKWIDALFDCPEYFMHVVHRQTHRQNTQKLKFKKQEKAIPALGRQKQDCYELGASFNDIVNSWARVSSCLKKQIGGGRGRENL